MGNESNVVRVQTERVPDNEAGKNLEETILEQGGIAFKGSDQLDDQLAALGRESMDRQTAGKIALVLESERQYIGLDFDPTGGGKKAKNAYMRGELSQPDVPTNKVVITQTTDQRLNNLTFQADISDAPTGLQTAVDNAWDQLQRDLPKYGDDIPPELAARQAMLEPIIRARLARVDSPVSGIQTEDAEPVSEVASSQPASEPYNVDRLKNQVPADDAAVMGAYRAKGWNKLGRNGRKDYQERKGRLQNGNPSDSEAA